jgi:hypothetical protein
MATTPRTHVAVPPALLTAARERLGLPVDARTADVVRGALAAVAGLPIEDHTPKRTGRPPRKAAAA